MSPLRKMDTENRFGFNAFFRVLIPAKSALALSKIVFKSSPFAFINVQKVWRNVCQPTCPWRIVIPALIPWDFPSCYDSSMRDLAVLFIHLIAVLARLLGPGRVPSVVAESLLLKHRERDRRC